MTKTQQAEAMARRLLWLAFCWNDHNFGPAHEQARKEAETHGIRSFDEANSWLASEDYGYMEAFYEMAAMLGINGARTKSPAEVYEDEIKPALEMLIACALDHPPPKPCRHCDIRAASWGLDRPSSFHYKDCPTHGMDLPHGGKNG